MPNIYHRFPDLTSHMTTVRALTAVDGGLAVAFDQNIFRPEGGGQPQDLGQVVIGDLVVDVRGVFKSEGETWTVLDGTIANAIAPGDVAVLQVNSERRAALSKSHTLSHLMMAAARHVLADFDSKGALIGDDGNSVAIRFRTTTDLQKEHIDAIDCLTRHFVLRNAAVKIASAKSVEAGAKQYRHWRVDSELGLSGKIRVVEIVGVDANPCAGSHVKQTSEIGPFMFTGLRKAANSVVTLTTERSVTWMYWFGDRALVDSPLVRLSEFAE